MSKEEIISEINKVDKRIHNAHSVYSKRDLNKYRKRLKRDLKKLEMRDRYEAQY